MSIADRRIEKAWSQEDLADISGLSVRTIQRAETGGKLGLESLKALAAVFETDVSTLIEEQKSMTTQPEFHALPDKEQRVIEEIRQLKNFYVHLVLFVVIIGGLAALDYFVTPDDLWIQYVIMGWGGGLIIHAIYLFGIGQSFGKEWEQREFEKRMRR